MSYPIAKHILKIYNENFEGVPIIVRSPGRVNIIGEHTDYNEGFVLPAAIDKATFVAVGKRDDGKINLIAENFNARFEKDLTELSPVNSWPDYIIGVADQMIKRGHQPTGFNLVIQGDVPFGAGLSSSASVACATAVALNEQLQLNIPSIELIDIAQKAEHTFAGVLCGIMDQFVSVLGKKDHVIKLDCRSLEYEYEPLELKGIKIVLLNTNVKHALASTEYNTRHQECRQGVEVIKKYVAGINSLRDVTSDMLKRYLKPADRKIYQRCKYVVEENIRLLQACDNLRSGDITSLGKQMYASHDGLSKEYEVSCTELDFLVAYVKHIPGVLGARMMGGGFGGCTINLVKEEFVDELIANISTAYHINTGKELTAYIAATEDGSRVITNL
ncbi:MAG TPA: galactokinase [Ferruginibacter sp.]|jgi:galactokinase|nr:galactokinase [Ferruginibacter sp.]